MTLVDIEAPPVDKAKRNGKGQYLARPVKGKRRLGYTRATTIAKTLTDDQFEAHWKRTTLAGGHLDPELAAECHRLLGAGEKHQAGQVAAKAFTLAGGNIKRDRGTLVHSYVENKLLNPDYVVPELYRDQVDAIIAKVRARGFEFVTDFCEQMVVIDELKIAGTVDFILYHADSDTYYIGDLKTGSVDYGALEWSIQLYIYATADCAYIQGDAEDGSDDQRIDLPPVDRARAVIINAPLDTVDVDLYWLDLSNGPQLLELCMKVREARRLKSKVLTKFEGGGTNAATGQGTASTAHNDVVGTVDDPTDAAALAIFHEARTAWLINRTAALVERLSKAHVAEVWPTDIARPGDIKAGTATWSMQDQNLISMALDALEAKHDVPFGDEDPVVTHARRMDLEAKLAAEAHGLVSGDGATREDAQAGEGDSLLPDRSTNSPDTTFADPDAVDTVMGIVKTMAKSDNPDDRERIGRVQAWQRQASSKNVSWKIGGYKRGEVPERLYAIVAAAVGCLDLIDLNATDPDRRVRDLLAAVLDDDIAQQPTASVGALFGLLTTDQALRLAEMAEVAT